MDPRRTRSGDAAPDAALRRLDLLGRQLSAEQHGEARPEDREPSRPVHPAAGGRHRSAALSRRQRWSGDLYDRMPVRVQSLIGRGVSVHHVIVVLALLAAVVCVTAWWVVTSRPTTVTPLSAPVVPSASSATASGAPSPRPTSGAPSSAGSVPNGSPTEVVVDVTGKVRRPGIVTLPVGSRVTDAVHAAGGARPGISVRALNLARVLVDGEQIVVGLPPVAAAVNPPAGAPPAGPVNLNMATMDQLDELPGVGPVTAQSILDWRSEHGRFATVDELLEVRGIGDATLADLRDLVTV